MEGIARAGNRPTGQDRQHPNRQRRQQTELGNNVANRPNIGNNTNVGNNALTDRTSVTTRSRQQRRQPAEHGNNTNVGNNMVNRPNIGNNTNIGNNIVNRPNIGNNVNIGGGRIPVNVNRPGGINNSGNITINNVNNNINNIT